MLRFAPQPWEMPPHYAVLQGSIVRRQHRLGRQECEWETALIRIPACRRPILRLRPLAQENDAGFVAFYKQHYQTKHFEADTAPDVLRNALANVLDLGLFARHFFLNEHGELRQEGEVAREAVLVAPDGVAAWSMAAIVQEVRDAALFPWRAAMKPSDFARLPAQDVWRQLKQRLADPDGEAAFARQFAQWDDATRRARIQQPARGDITQIKLLLRDLLIASPVWEQTEGSGVGVTVYPSGVAEFYEDGENGDCLETPRSFLEGVTRIWRHFEPYDPRVGAFKCVRQFSSTLLFLHSHRPSAHERLEAHFRFRTWLEESGT